MTLPALTLEFWKATAMISTIVVTSSAGDLLTAAAMKSIGDLDEVRARAGLRGAIRAVVTCPLFFVGIFFMAAAFFSLLYSLNHMHLSLVGPAAASLTMVTNTVAAQFFLKEKVDKRRWTAAILVCVGVYFLAH